MARSLTVPHTASRPMSPPGKNSGATMCESVVTASRAGPAGQRQHGGVVALLPAPGCSGRGQEAALDQVVRHAARRCRAPSRSVSSWAQRHRADRPFDDGNRRRHASSGPILHCWPPRDGRSAALSAAAVAIVRRAGAFRGDHRRAERDARACTACQRPGTRAASSVPAGSARRCTAAILPVCDRLQRRSAVSASKAANSGRRRQPLCRDARRCRASCGRTLRRPAPITCLGGRLPSRVTGPGVGVLHLHLARSPAAARSCRMPCTRSSGSKPVTTIGTRYLPGDRRVFPVAHHRADVPGGQKALHAVVRRAQDGVHGRRHAHVRDQHAE